MISLNLSDGLKPEVLEFFETLLLELLEVEVLL
jgi:hypothetical protein